MTSARVAVVFDSAGTLLRTWRTVKDVATGEVLQDVQTTTLTAGSRDRALTMLPVHPRAVIDEPVGTLISEYLQVNGIGFAISCGVRPMTHDEVGAALFGDRRATMGDLQDCIRAVWACCRTEPAVALNVGVIVNLALPGIEYAVATGGVPFPGAVEAIGALGRLGTDVYVASGDRIEKLLPMTRGLGVPDERVYGTATPEGKAAIVRRLREGYDRVLMVGDGENDVAAMREADLGVLSLQQPGERSEMVRGAAGAAITDLGEVVGIVRRMTNGLSEGI
ncbi:MAG: HAD family hydrolase [Methanospirillum sp.]|nr:HAD family hydrolase [Methanospirillum sp.]